jgi:glycosyltransferase involved in cell wall biosynthesis
LKFTISYVFADRPGEFNTSNFRMIMPGKALGKIGYGVSAIPAQLFQENTPDAQKVLEQSHVIIVERNYIGDMLTQIMYWKVRGKVMILNWDDAYHAIEKTNISYPFWHDSSIEVEENGEKKKLTVIPRVYDQFLWGIKIGHAATLPSKRLMNYWKGQIPVYYVPNYFETEYYINIPKNKRNNVVIGWGGSVSHVPSFKESGVLNALKNVCEVRENVKVMICGDNRVYDAIQLPDNKKIFQPYVPYEEWGGIIARSFDIGIAPLSGEYDEYRSWIKPIEFLLTKTPWIASDNVAYDEFKGTGYGKIVQNDVDSWTNALLKTIDNIEKENEKISGDPFEFAKMQDVNLHAEEIANVYRKIAKEQAKVDLYDHKKEIKLINVPKISDLSIE